MTEDDKALVERVAMLPDGNAWPSTVELLCDLRDRIEQLGREKAVVSDLWEQQKEIALDYLADCNALSAENERLQYLNDLNAVPAGIIEDRGRKEERAAIIAWLMREEEDYPSSEYSGFAAMIREEIEAGEHLK